MKPSFRWVVLGAALFFAAIYAAEGFLFKDYNVDEFQVATGYLVDTQPGIYPRDFVWGKADMVRNLHMSVRRLMEFTNFVTGGIVSEPIDLFLLWLPVCQAVFFIGIYLLASRFTRNRWASFLIACSFMLTRRIVWDWWGLGPTYTMSARGLVLCCLPLMLWWYFRCERRLTWLIPSFLAWGAICNLHPLSGWGAVELLGITLLIADRFRWRTWLEVLAMGICTLVGSAYFISQWLHVAVVPAGQQATGEIAREFLAQFGGLTPPARKFVVGFLQDITLPLILTLWGFWRWRKSAASPPSDERPLRVLYLFPVVTVVMTVLVMAAGYAMRSAGVNVPIMVAEHSRSIKLIYLAMTVWMAFALSFWIQDHVRPLAKWGVPIALALALMCINFPGHKLANHLLCSLKWTTAREVRSHCERLEGDRADFEVAAWARANTPKDALFYFDSYEFRYYSRRSLVFCWFDKACVGYHPSKELEEWILRRDRVLPLKKAGDARGMLDAAREFGADYLVVLNSGHPMPDGKPVWSNSRYFVYRAK
jgi:hypothetical protein